MQSSQDGGAAVSVSKRKTKPKKPSLGNANASVLAGAAGVGMGQVRTDIDGRQELIADDEERYCVCGDVSYGEMICCELDEKVRPLTTSFTTAHRLSTSTRPYPWKYCADLRTVV
jgi:hypothetical protein